MKYVFSKNYERLTELLEKGENVILCNSSLVSFAVFQNKIGFHFGIYNHCGLVSIKGSNATDKEEARQEFISWCKNNGIKFIDFESQNKTEKEIVADELYDALLGMVEMWKGMAEKIPLLGNEKTYLKAVDVINKIKN